MYTIEDLEKAKKELANWNEKATNYRRNNPNVYQSDIKSASANVRHIEQYLKDNGVLEKSEREKLNDELDKLYPNAPSKSVHELNGKKYRIYYFPVSKSRSGKTVQEWGHDWEEV